MISLFESLYQKAARGEILIKEPLLCDFFDFNACLIIKSGFGDAGFALNSEALQVFPISNGLDFIH